MKKIFLFIAIAVAAVAMGCQPTEVAERDYVYEAYCDSIWESDPDYYMDVIEESDEYQEYIEAFGQWWEE